MSSFACPPIIISPVDPDCGMSKEECQELRKRIKNADDGDVIVIPFAVELHVFVDGYWIPSDQLSSFQAPSGEDHKREPGESYYDPQSQ